MSEVMTVTGPVPATSLGVVMPHEHMLCDLSHELGLEGLLTDVELIQADLHALRAAGCATIVEVSPREVRGDVSLIAGLATRAGLRVVLGTAFYRHSYYDHDLMTRATADELAELLVSEIESGVADAVPAATASNQWRREPAARPDPPIRPGVIGELGWDRFRATPTEERAFRAAARAHHATGLTITTHASRGAGLAQLGLLSEEGVAPHRVVVGHCDALPDPGYHLAIAEAGAWVQFDTFAHSRSGADIERRADWVVRLVRAGHADRILLSNDVCVRSNHGLLGGRGYAGVLDTLAPALRGQGLGACDVTRLLADNPQRALSGD